MKVKKSKEVNQRQQEFYDSKRKNVPTRLWSYFRNGALNRIKKSIGIEKDIYNLHKNWFGDLSGQKVLDLGCYSGNSLSIYLAKESRSYLGIDLSRKGVENLNRRLKNIPNATAEVKDFLSDDFEEGGFDVIYAYGVLHHFRNVEELITRLKEKLSPGGIIISHDPLETSRPIKLLRSIYRPFQSDKDWEWPFSRETYYKFDQAFDIKERRAVLGKTKWVTFLNLLPISESRKKEKAQTWHRLDWEKSRVNDEHMFSGMHLSMLMQNIEEE